MQVRTAVENRGFDVNVLGKRKGTDGKDQNNGAGRECAEICVLSGSLRYVVRIHSLGTR